MPLSFSYGGCNDQLKYVDLKISLFQLYKLCLDRQKILLFTDCPPKLRFLQQNDRELSEHWQLGQGFPQVELSLSPAIILCFGLHSLPSKTKGSLCRSDRMNMTINLVSDSN